MDIPRTDPVTEAKPQDVPRTQASPQKWLGKIEKRYQSLRKEWLADADKCVNIYECKDRVKYPFNILYSNTETVLPALYNSTPRPEVARRYTTMDQQSKVMDSAVAAVAERTLEYLADTNHAEYETYSQATKDAVRGMLVPGLGQARVQFHSEGNYQTVCFETVPYDRFLWAYARRWKAVPWVAFGHDMLKDEFEGAFSDFVKSKAYKDFNWEAHEKETREDAGNDDNQGPKAKAGVLVWELWEYSSKTRRFLCEAFRDDWLLEESYPTRLTGRFPCPQPLMFAKKSKDQVPIPAYTFYEGQAEELNVISKRIIRIVRALKVRGLYNGAFGEDLNNLLNEDDENILVPTQEGTIQDGIDKYIWMMPIDMLVSTLQSLIASRDQCKQTIYEIMGISDIQRGSSDPNETAKAQEIKNTWGGLRVKKAQKDVQEFCLELFRIAFEYTTSYFSPATYSAITKLPFLFESQIQQAQMAMQQYQAMMEQGKAQYEQMAQQAQVMGQQPPPPPPPPPPPVEQEMQIRMQMPSWEKVVGMMQNSFERSYRVDIETNSTVDLEATEDKADIAEFMNAFGQMTSGLGPMMENGTMPFEAGKLIMSETFRRFRFGRRVQEALDMMQPPKPQTDPKEMERQAKEQVRQAQEQGKKEMDMALTQKDMEQKSKELGWTQEKLQLETQLALEKIQGQQQKAAHSAERSQIKADYQGKTMLQQQQMGEKVQQVQEGTLKQLVQQVTELQKQVGMLVEMEQAEDENAGA